MTLGEFRALTAALPDSAELAVDNGDGELAEITDTADPLPPVLEHDWLLVIRTGQPIWIEVDYDDRRDAHDAYKWKRDHS